MRTFSISSEYIFNSTASLNLILATAMSSSASTSAPTSAPTSAAPLPPTNTPTANDDYNASQAVVSFSVIVKPAFIKYLEETQNALIKRVIQEKYNNIIS